MANNSNRPSKPAVYYKMKARIIEELAIRRIVEGISDEDGQLQIPRDWFDEVEELVLHLMQLVRDEQ